MCQMNSHMCEGMMKKALCGSRLSQVKCVNRYTPSGRKEASGNGLRSFEEAVPSKNEQSFFNLPYRVWGHILNNFRLIYMAMHSRQSILPL